MDSGTTTDERVGRPACISAQAGNSREYIILSEVSADKQKIITIIHGKSVPNPQRTECTHVFRHSIPVYSIYTYVVVGILRFLIALMPVIVATVNIHPSFYISFL